MALLSRNTASRATTRASVRTPTRSALRGNKLSGPLGQAFPRKSKAGRGILTGLAGMAAARPAASTIESDKMAMLVGKQNELFDSFVKNQRQQNDLLTQIIKEVKSGKLNGENQKSWLETAFDWLQYAEILKNIRDLTKSRAVQGLLRKYVGQSALSALSALGTGTIVSAGAVIAGLGAVAAASFGILKLAERVFPEEDTNTRQQDLNGNDGNVSLEILTDDFNAFGIKKGDIITSEEFRIKAFGAQSGSPAITKEQWIDPNSGTLKTLISNRAVKIVPAGASPAVSTPAPPAPEAPPAPGAATGAAPGAPPPAPGAATGAAGAATGAAPGAPPPAPGAATGAAPGAATRAPGAPGAAHDATPAAPPQAPGPNATPAGQTSVAQNKSHLIRAMEAAGYNDPSQRAGLLAISHGESGTRPINENMNYTAANLLQTFPGRFTPQQAAQLAAGGPEAVANELYRTSAGNNQAGDGYRYRGRGFIQLTGRANYAKYSAAAGIDLLENPDALLDPAIAARVSVAYMQDRTRGQGNFQDQLRAVGGARSGWAGKQAEYDRLMTTGEASPGGSLSRRAVADSEAAAPDSRPVTSGSQLAARSASNDRAEISASGRLTAVVAQPPQMMQQMQRAAMQSTIKSSSKGERSLQEILEEMAA